LVLFLQTNRKRKQRPTHSVPTLPRSPDAHLGCPCLSKPRVLDKSLSQQHLSIWLNCCRKDRGVSVLVWKPSIANPTLHGE